MWLFVLIHAGENEPSERNKEGSSDTMSMDIPLLSVKFLYNHWIEMSSDRVPLQTGKKCMYIRK